LLCYQTGVKWSPLPFLCALAVGCSAAPPVDEPAALTEEPVPAAEVTVPEGFRKAEVLHVVEVAQGFAVLLAEESHQRVIPIFVGQTEAMAIHLRLQRRRYERPLTHDLLDDMLSRLKARVVKVHIDGVKTGVFVGTVFVATATETLEFDARSSDAIALAVGNGIPIFVADDVFETAGISREELEQRPLPPEEEGAPFAEPL